MVAVVHLNPTGGSFIFHWNFLKPPMSILYTNVRFVLKMKNPNAFIKSCSIDSRNKQSPTCEVMHETKESSLQESPTDSCLAQLVEQKSDDLEVVSSNLTGGNFWQNLFCVV